MNNLQPHTGVETWVHRDFLVGFWFFAILLRLIL